MGHANHFPVFASAPMETVLRMASKSTVLVRFIGKLRRSRQVERMHDGKGECGIVSRSSSGYPSTSVACRQMYRMMPSGSPNLP